MVNKKLISIRLDQDVLEKIDELRKRHSYWKRSAIINQILSILLKCANDDVLWQMMKVFYAYEKGYVIRFEVDKEKIIERKKPAFDD